MKNWVPVHGVDPETGRLVHDPREERQLEYDRADFAANTDIGRRQEQQKADVVRFGADPMGQDALRHWAGMGLKKELFDAGHDGGKYAYSVFTPLELLPDKKYALVYMSHGGGHTIEIAEHYGWNRLAAREKFIVVYPFNGGRSNQEADTEFPRILGELRRKGYPIDWERVYCAGFSSGSEATVCAACTTPERVAAVAVLPGGQPFKDLQFYSAREYYASMKSLRMPGCFIGGTVDVGNFPAPWVLDPSMRRKVEQPTTEERVANLDIWMREIAQVNGHQTLTLEGITKRLTRSENPVEREFGLTFHRTYTFRAEGCDWLGGELYGGDGAPVMRYARAVGVPHIVWDSQLKLTWDFLRHFRRDQKTGESIYDPIACWGER